MKQTLIIQSFRDTDVPPWIERCLESVRDWAASAGHDYRMFGDEAFTLCGEEYLRRAAGNMRTITNLCRLELIRRAHADGYEQAIWIDADVFVFDPGRFSLEGIERYAFARETWIEHRAEGRWRAFSAVNNSVFACRAREPDLDFLIAATRHIALNRQVTSNYQVGGDLIKGLAKSLAFERLDSVAMLSNYVVLAISRSVDELIVQQATLHGTPVFAANICASSNYYPQVSDVDVKAAMDQLETTHGGVLNDRLGAGPALTVDQELFFDCPGLEARLGIG